MYTEFGHSQVVQYLIQKGANIEAQLVSGATPLVIACQKVKQVHLKHQHNILCLQKGFREIVQMLIDEGAKLSAYGGMEYNSLHLAVIGGFTDIVRILLENGIKVDELSKNGKTALDLAISSKSIAMVSLLLRYGADYTKKYQDISRSDLSHLFEGNKQKWFNFFLKSA